MTMTLNRTDHFYYNIAITYYNILSQCLISENLFIQNKPFKHLISGKLLIFSILIMNWIYFSRYCCRLQV